MVITSDPGAKSVSHSRLSKTTVPVRSIDPHGSDIVALKSDMSEDVDRFWRAAQTSRRLLTCKQAADYCGISASTFMRICDVRPVILSDYGSRLKRFDILDVNAWIEQRKIGNTNLQPSKDDVIDELLK